MANFLLLGAGFSRNWGGWLATEAFEYLLGCPEVVRNANLQRLLWRFQHQGGFEAALAELQLSLSRNPGSDQQLLNELQSAISRMFADMNGAFLNMEGWEFQNEDRERMIGTFLTRFDAIFTLNQDVLLEQHYTNENIALIGKRKWAGSELPGMKRTPPQDAFHSTSWARSSWSPLVEDEFKTDPNFQPIYKLHGSSNWVHADGKPMLIMGGAKVREIGQTPILSWYAKVFEERLAEKSSRLMSIGYGFRDEHINATIARAIEGGLKLFIIAPEGADLARQNNPTQQAGHIAAPTPLEAMLEQSLVGASRRSLREIFGSDIAEHNKVMRFFVSSEGLSYENYHERFSGPLE
jgi:hypothetical protein